MKSSDTIYPTDCHSLSAISSTHSLCVECPVHGYWIHWSMTHTAMWRQINDSHTHTPAKIVTDKLWITKIYNSGGISASLCMCVGERPYIVQYSKASEERVHFGTRGLLLCICTDDKFNGKEFVHFHFFLLFFCSTFSFIVILVEYVFIIVR